MQMGRTAASWGKIQQPGDPGVIQGWRPSRIPWGLLLVATALMAAGAAGAQEGPGGVPSGEAEEAIPVLVVRSDPTGAIVTLRGPYEWVGQTPWRLYRPLDGLYSVEARFPGYETWSGEAIFGPGGIRELDIRLARKTRYKAAARSALMPGWGQYYNGARTKGTIFLIGEATALTALIVTHVIYKDKVDDYETARDRYLESRDIDEWPELRRQAEKAADKADQAYDNRQIALAGAIGVYALSILDAFLFHPGGAAVPAGMGAVVETETPGVSLAFEPGLQPRMGVSYRW